MIRVICPNCQSKLNAKEELLGQKRKCPKCGQAVLIARPDADSQPSPPSPQRVAEPAVERHARQDAERHARQDADQAARGDAEEGLHPLEVPDRLCRTSHYVICDKSRLVATWENNGQGWMLRTSSGPVSAARNQDKIPAEGNFTLVELKLGTTDQGHRLRGITAYQLARRWALTKLNRGNDKILSAVTGPGSLGREQKNVVRQAIKDRFMSEVFEGADHVRDYLANTDYHSPGTG